MNRIAEQLPGTVVWDIYVDESAGQMTMVEEFVDEQALIDYEASMTVHGFREELMGHAQLDNFVVLGALSDPGAARLAESLGASPQPLTISMSRQSSSSRNVHSELR